MTNYQKFLSKSVDELAEYLYNHDDKLLDEICSQNLPCPFGDKVEGANCIECVKRYLEKSVDGE